MAKIKIKKEIYDYLVEYATEMVIQEELLFEALSKQNLLNENIDAETLTNLKPLKSNEINSDAIIQAMVEKNASKKLSRKFLRDYVIDNEYYLIPTKRVVIDGKNLYFKYKDGEKLKYIEIDEIILVSEEDGVGYKLSSDELEKFKQNDEVKILATIPWDTYTDIGCEVFQKAKDLGKKLPPISKKLKPIDEEKVSEYFKKKRFQDEEDEEEVIDDKKEVKDKPESSDLFNNSLFDIPIDHDHVNKKIKTLTDYISKLNNDIDTLNKKEDSLKSSGEEYDSKSFITKKRALKSKINKTKKELDSLQTSLDNETRDDNPVDEPKNDSKYIEEPADLSNEKEKEVYSKRSLANYNSKHTTHRPYGKDKYGNWRELSDHKEIDLNGKKIDSLIKYLSKGPSIFIKRKLNDDTFELIPKEIEGESYDGTKGKVLYHDTDKVPKLPIIKLVNSEEGYKIAGIFIAGGNNGDYKKINTPKKLSDNTVADILYNESTKWLNNIDLDSIETENIPIDEIPVIKPDSLEPFIKNDDGDIEHGVDTIKKDVIDKINSDDDTEDKVDLGTEKEIEELGSENKTKETENLSDFDNGLIKKIIEHLSKKRLVDTKLNGIVDGETLYVRAYKFTFNKVDYYIELVYDINGDIYTLDYIDLVDKNGNTLFNGNETKIHTVGFDRIIKSVKDHIPFDFINMDSDSVNEHYDINSDDDFDDEDKYNEYKKSNENDEQTLENFKLFTELSEHLSTIDLSDFEVRFFKDHNKQVQNAILYYDDYKVFDEDVTIKLYYNISEDNEYFLFNNIDVTFEDGENLFDLLTDNKEIITDFINEVYNNLGTLRDFSINDRKLNIRKGRIGHDDFADGGNLPKYKSLGIYNKNRSDDNVNKLSSERKNKLEKLASLIDKNFDLNKVKCLTIDGFKKIKLVYGDSVGIVYEKNDDKYHAKLITIDELDLSDDENDFVASKLNKVGIIDSKIVSEILNDTKYDINGEDAELVDDKPETNSLEIPKKEISNEKLDDKVTELGEKIKSVVNLENDTFKSIDGIYEVKLISRYGVEIHYIRNEDESNYNIIDIDIKTLKLSDKVKDLLIEKLGDLDNIPINKMGEYLGDKSNYNVSSDDVDIDDSEDDGNNIKQKSIGYSQPTTQKTNQTNQQPPLKNKQQQSQQNVQQPSQQQVQQNVQQQVQQQVNGIQNNISNIQNNPGLRDKINKRVQSLLKKYTKGTLGNGLTNDLIKIGNTLGKATGKGYSMGKNITKATAYNTGKVAQAFSNGFKDARDAEDARNYNKDHNKYFRRKNDDISRMGNNTKRRVKKMFKENEELNFKSEELNAVKNKRINKGRN